MTWNTAFTPTRDRQWRIWGDNVAFVSTRLAPLAEDSVPLGHGEHLQQRRSSGARADCHGTERQGQTGQSVVWFISVDGLLADARHLPLEVQAQAFLDGVIPYIPALGRDGTTKRLEAR